MALKEIMCMMKSYISLKKMINLCFKFCFDLKWMRKRRVNKKLGVGWRSVGRGGILVYRMVE